MTQSVLAIQKQSNQFTVVPLITTRMLHKTLKLI